MARQSIFCVLVEFSAAFILIEIARRLLFAVFSPIDYLRRSLFGLLLFYVVFYGAYIIFLLLIIFVIRRGKWTLSDLGLGNRISWKRDISYGVLSFALIMLVISPVFPFLIPIYARGSSGIAALLSHGPIYLILILLLLVPIHLLQAPIPEELFYRGYYQGVLSETTQDRVAIIASGLFFGFIHGVYHTDWPIELLIIPIVSGVIFGIIYWKTGSLIPSMTGHFLVNYLLVFPPALYKDNLISEAYILFGFMVVFSIIALLVGRKQLRELVISAYSEFKQVRLRDILEICFFVIVSLLIVFAFRLLMLSLI